MYKVIYLILFEIGKYWKNLSVFIGKWLKNYVEWSIRSWEDGGGSC